MKGLNVLLAGFGTQVGSPRVANKSKQGIGRRIVVVQAEVRSTSKSIKQGRSANRWKHKGTLGNTMNIPT